MCSTTPTARTPHRSGASCSARSSAAYRDEYRPVPFSKNFVRHIEGWYAQKHPDEDFAETFAVWLTPRSPWRRQYKGWPAMRKLRYVERMARHAGRRRADRQDRRGGHHARRHQRDRGAVLRAGRAGAAGPHRHRARRAPRADLPDPEAQGIANLRPISSGVTCPSWWRRSPTGPACAARSCAG